MPLVINPYAFGPRYIGFQSSSSDLSAYTFSSWTLKAGLHVICVAGSAAASNIAPIAVTVGGAAATLVVLSPTTGSGNFRAAIFKYTVPSDGSYDIVVTPNATAQRFGCAVYELLGFNATETDTAGAADGASAPSMSIDVPSNGALMSICYLGDSTATPTFSAGISTTRVQTDMDSNDYALVGDYFRTVSESNRTVTATRGSTGISAGAAAAFGP